MSRHAPPNAADRFRHCPHCGTPNPPSAVLTLCLGCGKPLPSVVAGSKATGAERDHPRRTWLSALSWSYAGIILLVLLLMRWLGEHWWLATPLLYVPRALWLVPVAVLALIAAWKRQRGLWPLHLATAAVILGPLMSLSLPISNIWKPRPVGATLRIMSFNRGTDPIDLDRLRDLIDRERIDVACFQETHTQKDEVESIFRERGWNHDSRHSIFTRFPVATELPPSDLDGFREHGSWPVHLTRMRVTLPDGRDVVIACVHMPSIRQGFRLLSQEGPEGLTRYHAWRWEQIGALARLLAESRSEPVLVAGDLNLPRDSPLLDILRSDFHVGFEHAGFGYGFTYPAGWPWIGVDHILASPDWAITRCWVGPNFGSDHRPLIGEVVLGAQ